MSLERADRLADLLTEPGLDQLLVSYTPNIRYLCGFRGTNGMCLVGAKDRLFFTDFRYVERAEHELPEWDRRRAGRDLLDDVSKLMGGRVGFDDVHLSVRQLKRLEDVAPSTVELVPAGGLVERLRRQKDVAELDAIASAAELTDQVYRWSLERGLGGRTEREVARAAEARIRELDSEPSFPVIVAAGANGALPHAEPGDGRIEAGDLVVFDMGAVVDDYCSDCTRTFAVGDPGEDAREAYELVLGAQAAAVEAVRAGATVGTVDGAARSVIEAAGRGEEFGHPTGHGVGLEVHEAPRVGPGEDELLVGDVVTVEPGVYLAGRFGVRIEDLVVVGDEGMRNLSGLPKDLQIVE